MFCTLAQTGRVSDVFPRPENVHDSHGAREFILACIACLQKALPWVKIEVRMDSAFFSDAIVSELDEKGVEFSLSVPFERFVVLKKRIEERSKEPIQLDLFVPLFASLRFFLKNPPEEESLGGRKDLIGGEALQRRT